MRSNDELVRDFKTLFDELHAKADALPPGPERRFIRLLVGAFHAAGEALRRKLVDDAVIQPFSGGEEKPEGNP